jgi:hypothetical protein
MLQIKLLPLFFSIISIFVRPPQIPHGNFYLWHVGGSYISSYYTTLYYYMDPESRKCGMCVLFVPPTKSRHRN